MTFIKVGETLTKNQKNFRLNVKYFVYKILYKS